jgi:hypothetical protein
LETAENQGRLEYYDLTPDPTDDPTYNTRKKTYGAGISWWMASPTATNGSTENFCSVQSSGGSFTYGSAANSAFLFIIPAFCVR